MGLYGDTLADAFEHLESEFVRARGMILVHPYDDVQVAAGQGTVALEMLRQVPDLDTLLIPVGGGGLFAGAVVAHSIAPKLRVVGVESVGYCSAYAAINNDPESIRGGPTIAEGIAVKNIGKVTLPNIRDHAYELIRVEETVIERAIALLANVEKVVAEGAGAVGLAALLADWAKYAGRKVGLIISGGNIDGWYENHAAQIIADLLAAGFAANRLRVATGISSRQPGTCQVCQVSPMERCCYVLAMMRRIPRQFVNVPGARKNTIGEQRARLVVQCACELLGITGTLRAPVIRVDVTAEEFNHELQRRYGATHPELVNRNGATIERARLDRDEWPELPRIILRQGAPIRKRQSAVPQPRPSESSG